MPALPKQVLVLSFVMVFTGAAIYMASLFANATESGNSSSGTVPGGIEMVDVKEMSSFHALPQFRLPVQSKQPVMDVW